MNQNITEPIFSHIHKYLNQLNTGREFLINDLIDSFVAFEPILHRQANSDKLDTNALLYSLSRLPQEIIAVNRVLLVQSYDDIKDIGFDITKWHQVYAPSRRRLCFINPIGNTIACLLSSESDIHDLINCLISFQIERNKLRSILKKYGQTIFSQGCAEIELSPDQWDPFPLIFGGQWQKILSTATNSDSLSLKLYGQIQPQYQQNAALWMDNLLNHSLILGLKDTPVYFVSSNSHSLINIIGGFLNNRQSYIFDYVSQENNDLFEQWLLIKKQNNTSRINDFLYYVSGRYLQINHELAAEKAVYESGLGIHNINSTAAFQSSTQIIPVKSITASRFLDPALNLGDSSKLAQSTAYIINIEYPLGEAAYYLLNQFIQTFSDLRSAYIMGKAGIFSGNIGDIQIPIDIYDEKFDISYKFNNFFNNYKFQAHTSQVFKKQREVCVYGTYLESQSLVNTYVNQGINIIEMENGHYLRSIVEHKLLNHNPVVPHTFYDLSDLPFEIGVINYASDNPLIQTLAEETVSLRGIEPVYLASLSVVQRIIDLEIKRLSP